MAGIWGNAAETPPRLSMVFAHNTKRGRAAEMVGRNRAETPPRSMRAETPPRLNTHKMKRGQGLQLPRYPSMSGGIGFVGWKEG